jgi:nucleotide-binding universal stress UspA family protein
MMYATKGLRLATSCRNVLVPLDGSREAELALGHGRWLARCFGADLHLITADVFAMERYWYEPYLKTIAGDAVPATGHCTEDRDVVGAIHELARRLEPCLVCMATHGRSRSAALLGSTFARLVAAGEPLVAVGPRPSPAVGPDPHRTVACLDRTATTPVTEQLVDQAAMWARAFGHRLTLATVAGRHDRPEAEHLVQSLAADPGIDDLDVDGLVLDGSGGPHGVLAHHLHDQPATFLAAATHARTGAALALTGSETARIVHDSPIPVLVVPFHSG